MAGVQAVAELRAGAWRARWTRGDGEDTILLAQVCDVRRMARMQASPIELTSGDLYAGL